MASDIQAVKHEAWTAAVGALQFYTSATFFLIWLLHVQIPVRLTLSPGEVTVVEGPPAALHVCPISYVGALLGGITCETKELALGFRCCFHGAHICQVL